MATKLQKVVIDCEKGTTEYIDLTDEELEEVQARETEAERIYAEREAEAQAKAEAKASALAKLAALGLTEEEAAAIAG